MQQDFNHHFQIHLDQLKKEIEAYPRDADIWIIREGISNSAGTLCYHLLGNLNHFIGKALGGTDYVRNRSEEFSIRDVPRADLVVWIDKTKEVVRESLAKVNDLNAPYPEEYFGEKATVLFQLLRLLGHFNYHLGQVNYHRRLLSEGS